MNYLVKLRLYIDGHEKHTIWLIGNVDSEQKAGEQALINECHGEPDFEYFNYKIISCNDNDMIYEIKEIKQLTDEQAAQYRELIS